MNIGYLIKFPWYPPTGGATVHAYQVAEKLMKKGHHIKTISYWHEAPGLEIYRRRELFKFLHDIDVLYIRIHGNWTLEHCTLLKLLKWFRLPVVWEINSPLEEAIDMKRRSPGEVRSLNRRRKFFAKMVDAAVCVSDVMKDYAQNYLGIKNSHVVPNGSDPEQFSPSKKDNSLYKGSDGKFKVLWSGSANYPWQGVELISEVAEAVYALDRDIQFVLISNEKHLKQYNIFDKNVIIVDKKPYLEISSYIASTDAGLCLYKDYGWNGKFYFSPLKLFDFMACGLPVIGSNMGQIAQVIRDKDNGFLTNNSVEDIAKKILYLKNHPKEAKQMGERARSDIKRHYNWGRVVDNVEQVMKDVVKG